MIEYNNPHLRLVKSSLNADLLMIKGVSISETPFCIFFNLFNLISVAFRAIFLNSGILRFLSVFCANSYNWARLAKFEGYIAAAEKTIIPIAKCDRSVEDAFRGIIMLYKWD